MAMTVGEANAVNAVIHHLVGDHALTGQPFTREEAIDALVLLVKGAYKTVLAGYTPEESGRFSAREALAARWPGALLDVWMVEMHGAEPEPFATEQLARHHVLTEGGWDPGSDLSWRTGKTDETGRSAKILYCDGHHTLCCIWPARVHFGPLDGTAPVDARDEQTRACKTCGCTEDEPCEGGCAWVADGSLEIDLCTACAWAIARDAVESGLYAQQLPSTGAQDRVDAALAVADHWRRFAFARSADAWPTGWIAMAHSLGVITSVLSDSEGLALAQQQLGGGRQLDEPVELCPHCPDGHSDPDTRPWSVWVTDTRVDGQAPCLIVAPSEGAHVAESDAEWLRQTIRGSRHVINELRQRALTAEALRPQADDLMILGLPPAEHMPSERITAFLRFCKAVWAECDRQWAKWGDQAHPDGTGPREAVSLGTCYMSDAALYFKAACQQAAKQGRVTWRHILLEEIFEGMERADLRSLSEELVQSSAVLATWLFDLGRRSGHGLPALPQHALTAETSKARAEPNDAIFQWEQRIHWHKGHPTLYLAGVHGQEAVLVLEGDQPQHLARMLTAGESAK